MPSIPFSSISSTSQESNGPRSHFCQGMVFHELPSRADRTGYSGGDDTKLASNDPTSQRRGVAVTVINHDSDAGTAPRFYTQCPDMILTSLDVAGGHTPQTRLETYGFEQRQVELVDGFNEISGSNVDPESIPRSWDWVSLYLVDTPIMLIYSSPSLQSYQAQYLPPIPTSYPLRPSRTSHHPPLP